MVHEAPYSPGQRVLHGQFGEGVIVKVPRDGYVRAFFGVGERQVPIASLRPLRTRAEQILAGVAGDEARQRRAWLTYEAYALPLMESAAALTSARIDLLPHQVVLTHRIATASPRRYLIADEVGLGKTIETALLLRELASRGEMRRALMVVPAGLVNNWHRELNEVFHLDFEVFGSEGDVTDRKSNAFAKHDRLIASIDTLKRPARVRRLKEAPPWDLVVFDEAHHLTAYRNGRKVRKTENYKLAEALKDHSRDLVLLSATPHQGDHFRFWMLIQLLNPTLFNSPEEMVEHRHRLNTVVFRRTKADACKPDGSPLFSRRWVHTESFLMSPEERRFYGELREYLEDGFALAKRQGNQGRALGFVMAIFQKIAASSFAAVRRTLRRRLLMLTLHEAILKDQDLDIDAREALGDEARALIREIYGLADDPVGRGEVDRILADLKLKLLRKLNEEELALASDAASGEQAAAGGEDLAAMAVSLALPEERLRIRDLLQRFPQQRETKVEKLLRGLGALWKQNPNEKVVIFATYLGTVDLLGREIEEAYPGQGVVVLRGGDHGAKVAAERRFRAKDGPRVLVCTAAGREGINLQFARILFNFDLPWNPMDVEQRIGRIHRYGQAHTAQVYNLVLSDTIEGRIFLLLNDKLEEIARTLGKLDEHGNIGEDLRSQILGQLSERIKYDRLYQEALSDPELRRTKEELDAALANAAEARKVVFELFQDLEGFSLDDYKPFADVSAGVDRLVRFLRMDLVEQGQRVESVGEATYEVRDASDAVLLRFTTDRDRAREEENLDLLGLDHPLIQRALARRKDLPPDELGFAVRGEGGPAVLSWWFVETHGRSGEKRSIVQPLAVDIEGRRVPALERMGDALFTWPPAPPGLTMADRERLLREHLEPMLQRDLQHRGLVPDNGGYSSTLIGWVEIAGIGARP
jgi:superfamily II DNA or RNA helicase